MKELLLKTLDNRISVKDVTEYMSATSEGEVTNDKIDMAIMAATDRIAFIPEFSRVAANLLHQKLLINSTASGFAEYVMNSHSLDSNITSLYDLDILESVIEETQSEPFEYLGLKTLVDRYLLPLGNPDELPQWMFMRVAMGIASVEVPEQRTDRAIEFYRLMASHEYMPSTPTLFNSCTMHPQMSSCYLTSVPDDLDGIFSSIKDTANLSKWAGGLGNSWSRVRGMGAKINGTGGEAQGVIPFMKVSNDTALACNQGGRRKGAFAAYLDTWHIDIEDFLELRKTTGDERRRTHDMNTANWVPDLFMERVESDGSWTMFSPNEVPELTETWGDEFVEHYTRYEKQVIDGTFKGVSKTMSAVSLWRKMLGMLFETGHPWITFKDACNRASPMSAMGIIRSSNLCTEITLNTSDDEIAVCNLGSVNLPKWVANGKKLETISTAIRMLDNVIDYNFYPVEAAERANKRHRPIGLGVMGLSDLAQASGQTFEQEDGVTLMRLINTHAVLTSKRLARERGSFPSHGNSTFDHPQRNSHVTAVAPTATISNIVGVSQSFEPTYSNLFVKSNLSGEFTVINKYLVEKLRSLGLWDRKMLDYLKIHDGSIQQHPEISDDVKSVFKTAFEIDPHAIVNNAAGRTPDISQSQSVNFYMAEPSGQKLHDLYMNAWKSGMKTTYYLRSLGATGVEKASVDDGEGEIPQCRIDDPDCEACQ